MAIDAVTTYVTLIIHVMLRKTRQDNATQQKDKATQHNLPKTVIFQRELSALGGTQTHVHPLYIF